MKKLLKPFLILLTIFSLSSFCCTALNFINHSNNKFSLKYNKSSNNYWSYDIYQENQLFIRQEFIPAIRGNKKFKSKEDASKVGLLVVDKLNKGKKPRISKTEIEDLKIVVDNK